MGKKSAAKERPVDLSQSLSAADSFALGKEKSAAQDYSSAAKCFSQCCALDPENAEYTAALEGAREQRRRKLLEEINAEAAAEETEAAEEAESNFAAELQVYAKVGLVLLFLFLPLPYAWWHGAGLSCWFLLMAQGWMHCGFWLVQILGLIANPVHIYIRIPAAAAAVKSLRDPCG